jgi:hypothetical protein
VDTGMPGRGGMLTGAQLLAAPEHEGSPAGAEKREGSAGILSQGPPELEWRCGGWTMVVEKELDGGGTRARREGEGGGQGAAKTRGGISLL